MDGTMKTKLADMLLLATTKHDGQFDKSGQPYMMHVLKVMHYTKTEDEELNCIALGHDLVEDTDVTVEYIEKHFGRRVAEGIGAMTKRKGQSYNDYLLQVASNQDAIRVKMADLRHNSDIRRLKGVTEKDIKRTIKYHEAYEFLKGELR